MNIDRQDLEIENLTEVLYQLQQEILAIKNDVEKLKLTSLIEKMHLFIEKTEDQLNNVKHDMEIQKQDITQLKQAIPSARQQRRPSEYRQLKSMLQSVKQTEQVPPHSKLSKKLQPATVKVTGIKTKHN